VPTVAAMGKQPVEGETVAVIVMDGDLLRVTVAEAEGEAVPLAVLLHDLLRLGVPEAVRDEEREGEGLAVGVGDGKMQYWPVPLEADEYKLGHAGTQDPLPDGGP
jgi:hypothetical protein